MDAVLAKPKTEQNPIGGSYLLDLPAVVEAHKPTVKAMVDPEAKPGWRRTMARTATLMARPEKA